MTDKPSEDTAQAGHVAATQDDPGRPVIKPGPHSKYWRGQKVYLKYGRGLLGPYLIADVVREKVYVLCAEETFELVHEGAEIQESDLEAAVASMSDFPQIQLKANESLAERFRPDRVGEYGQVYVLLLRWQESDLPRLSEEEDLLAKLFQDKFSFQVDRFSIPMKDGDLALEKRLLDLMALLRAKKPSLGIIHYGGHGDDDISVDARRKDAMSVWASHYKDGSSLCWSDIQPRLGRADADILLLLDCCFAAQAARGDGTLVIPPNVELLAACPKGCKTPSPMTEQSFTLALIREIGAGLARTKANTVLTVREIHQRLASKEAGLKETPVYFAKDKGTIRLRPLQTRVPTTADQTRADLPTITLRMMLRNSISDSLVDDVVLWLKQNAPPDIAQVRITELTNQTKELRDFVTEQSESRGTNNLINMKRLPPESQVQVRDAWSGFTGRLVGSLRYLAGIEDGQEDKDMDRFIQDFEANTNTLRRAVEREILTTPQLYDVENLEQGIQQPRSQILGLADAFRVRLTNFLPDSDFSHQTLGNTTAKSSYVFNPEFPGSLTVEVLQEWEPPVLVEWKQSKDRESAQQDIKRMNRLARALKAAGAGHFRTPICLGHVILPAKANAKYRLVFQIPQGDSEQVTLYSLLGEQKRQESQRITFPTLGERIRLAFEIAQALMRWHLAGWLHQGIASFHIVFFKTSPTTVDYSKPYLVGFGYARENDSSSVARAVGETEAETIRDLYRHPDRQGSGPEKKHQRKHDLYALGLLLIEIGRWMPLGDIFRSIVSNSKGNLSSIPKAAGKLTERVLAFNMGAAYRDATAASLRGNLGVVEDDDHGTRFIAAFESQVVRKLEAGLKIDE
ncbi:hypothetical protein ACJ41O_012225 [Fusarium nematophilum]